MSFHQSPFNIAWRVSNIVQIPIGLAFVVLSFWYPESPRFLLEKHPDDPGRALKNLAKIRSGSPDSDFVQMEFHEIVASYEFRKRYDPGYLGLLRNAGMRKRLCYGFYATALQQFGGIAALTVSTELIISLLQPQFPPSQVLPLHNINPHPRCTQQSSTNPSAGTRATKP